MYLIIPNNYNALNKTLACNETHDARTRAVVQSTAVFTRLASLINKKWLTVAPGPNGRGWMGEGVEEEYMSVANLIE